MSRLLIILLSISLIQGCFSTRDVYYDVQVDAITDPSFELKKTYILLNANEDVDATSLQYMEYESYIDLVMKKQGFVKSVDIRAADVAIFFGYGIGDPEERVFTYNVPIWGQTGVSSSTTTGVATYGSVSTISTQTTTSPSYGVTGSYLKTKTVVSYLRYMWLDTIDLSEYRETNNYKQVWKITARSSGTTSSLRNVLPALVLAIEPNIFKSSNGVEQKLISTQDPRIDELRKQSSQLDSKN